MKLAGVLLSLALLGCRAPDEVLVAGAQSEIASLGSAAKVGLSLEDLARVRVAAAHGDVETTVAIAAKGLRTPGAIARIESLSLAARRHVREASR